MRSFSPGLENRINQRAPVIKNCKNTILILSPNFFYCFTYFCFRFFKNLWCMTKYALLWYLDVHTWVYTICTYVFVLNSMCVEIDTYLIKVKRFWMFSCTNLIENVCIDDFAFWSSDGQLLIAYFCKVKVSNPLKSR